MNGPRIGSLFSGYGGLEMGVQMVLGGSTAWHVEFDPAPSRILAHHWPDVPNYVDVTAVDWSTVEPVDVLTGGFPCQDVSLAGRRAGMREGTRSGLWSHFARAIDTLRPGLVVIENVRGLLSAEAGDPHVVTGEMEDGQGPLGDRLDGPVLRALGAVLGDLADLGYDAEWCGLRAADAGAPHGRYRVFIVAHPAGQPWGVGHRDDVFARRGTLGRAPHTGHGGSADAAQFGWQRDRSARAGRAGSEDDDRADENAYIAVGGERRSAAPGQEESGRARTDAGGRGRTPAPNSDGRERDGRERLTERSEERGATPAGAGGRGHVGGSAAEAVADAHRFGRERRGVPADLGRPPRAGKGTRGERQRDGRAADDSGGAPVEWGAFGPAINRWAPVVGRVAPAPTQPDGKGGAHRLASRFVEWMMGLPEGHVTSVGLTRNEELKALGNGVVPQQAALGVRILLERRAVAA